MGVAPSFPFSAVVGSDLVKKAVLCAAVSPDIRTVLVRGPSGTAKTLISRAVGPLIGMDTVNVPLNVTEEQLFGGMDVEATVRGGRPVLQKGLLSRAHGGILYVDDANLMDQRMLASLLDCVIEGKVTVERDGVSAEYPCDTTLIATMNPDECDVGPHVLDRFDLCAVTGDGRGEREEILGRNMEFDRDPEGFSEIYAERESELSERMLRARTLVNGMRPSPLLAEVSVRLSAQAGTEGVRGDLALVRSALALAAMDGRTSVRVGDVTDAAVLALVHRRRSDFAVPDPVEESREGREPTVSDAGDEVPAEDVELEDLDIDSVDAGGFGAILTEVVFEVGERFRIIDYLGTDGTRVRRSSGRQGGRAMIESCDSTGRYVRSRIPEDGPRDIAFDATVRAAAPYQKGREGGGLSIMIDKQDIRRKVRERRSGCTIMFLVDASGSLGVGNKMVAAKGAILSMLHDSYVKRDRIGMMAFREDTCELMLPPTKSVEYAYRMLAELPTGGKTPVSEALLRSSEYMGAYVRSHQDESCYVVMVTDGISNVASVPGNDPNEEAWRIASGISISGVRWIVVDTGSGLTRVKFGKVLAEKLGAVHTRLRDLDADRLAESVRKAVGD